MPEYQPVKLQPTCTYLHTGQARSPHSINIVVIGDNGAGKSILINRLLNNDTLCQINDTEASSRSEIITYDFEDTNFSLCICDIAGSFQEWIARFCEPGHIRTSNIMNSPCPKTATAYPNLILFVWKANDIQFKNVRFMQSLELLKAANLVDNQQCNIIFVLTHCLSLGKTEKHFTQALMRKVYDVRLLASQILKLSHVNIVAVENLPQNFLLLQSGDFFELPNKDLSHRNLIATMFKLFTKNMDFTALYHTGRIIDPSSFYRILPRRRVYTHDLIKSIQFGNSTILRNPSQRLHLYPRQREIGEGHTGSQMLDKNTIPGDISNTISNHDAGTTNALVAPQTKVLPLQVSEHNEEQRFISVGALPSPFSGKSHFNLIRAP